MDRQRPTPQEYALRAPTLLTTLARSPRFSPLRRALGIAVVAAGAVTSLAGVTRLPRPHLLPAVIGLCVFIVGKYVCCPLRWRAVSNAEHSRGWYLRVFAEAELLGLCTPGHVAADVWRVRRLEQADSTRTAAVTEITADRVVGVIGVTAFAGAAAVTFPAHELLVAGSCAALAALALVVVVIVKPQLRRRIPPLPTGRRLADALAMSFAYQITVVVMLASMVHAVGQSANPLALMGVFGASQLVGVAPGPQGASPKDAALAVGLVTLGLPLAAAVGAVALKALLAWIPGIVFGAPCLALPRVAATMPSVTCLPTTEDRSLPVAA